MNRLLILKLGAPLVGAFAEAAVVAFESAMAFLERVQLLAQHRFVPAQPLEVFHRELVAVDLRHDGRVLVVQRRPPALPFFGRGAAPGQVLFERRPL